MNIMKILIPKEFFALSFLHKLLCVIYLIVSNILIIWFSLFNIAHQYHIDKIKSGYFIYDIGTLSLMFLIYNLFFIFANTSFLQLVLRNQEDDSKSDDIAACFYKIGISIMIGIVIQLSSMFILEMVDNSVFIMHECPPLLWNTVTS